MPDQMFTPKVITDFATIKQDAEQLVRRIREASYEEAVLLMMEKMLDLRRTTKQVEEDRWDSLR